MTVGFRPTDYTVSESDGEVQLFVAVLEGSLERSLTVRFATIPNSATEAGTVTLKMISPVGGDDSSNTLHVTQIQQITRAPLSS